MVKVFLEESAELCRARLDALTKTEISCRIICPSEFFIKKLIAFYPDLADKNLQTPSQLISEIGYTPIPAEIADAFLPHNPFLDPIIRWVDYIDTLEESEQTLTKDWLKGTDFWNFEVTAKGFDSFCKTCVFFGPFGPSCLNKIQHYLQPFFENFFAIRRTFKSEQILHLSQIKGYGVRNVQQEREYVREAYKRNTLLIACHPENWLELFQQKNDVRCLSWIDYQEKGTLGYFLPYLYTTYEDKEIRDVSIKNLKNAQKCCSSEDLCPLKNWLSLQDDPQKLPFESLSWPSEVPLGEFVQLFNNSDVSWKLTKVLESCPIKFSRRQFFAYLRKSAKHYDLKYLIPWEDALYFPIKNGCFLHGVSEDPDSDKQHLSWLKEVENRGGALTVVIPEMDEKSMHYTPLIPTVVRTQEVIQKLENFNISGRFILPKDRLEFSCKNWERFHLSPIKTWLDIILKAKKFDLVQPSIKARVCGEWVHENLEFKMQPKDLGAWRDSIAEKAEKRYQILKTIFTEKIPMQVQQWHTKTYRLSLRIAQACSDLLNGSWTLQSEYVLPKTAANSGRIDLFATRSNEAIIVDFKTAIDYTFTVGRLNKGHGLQLLLYGRALEYYYENIQLRVINGNCANFVLHLRDISHEIQSIESWFEAIKRTGEYTDPPEEKREMLPLCWR